MSPLNGDKEPMLPYGKLFRAESGLRKNRSKLFSKVHQLFLLSLGLSRLLTAIPCLRADLPHDFSM